MAKDNKDKGPPTPGKTPFQKFERLAKALVSVPKEKVREDKSQPTSDNQPHS